MEEDPARWISRVKELIDGSMARELLGDRSMED